MKDPAFLFYSADFVTGTQFMTDEQVGKYMRLLCAQHLTGHLPEKHMLLICKTHDPEIWQKFAQDPAGNFFNEVLEGHIEKRKNYSESRRNNRLKYKDTDNKAITDNNKKDMSNISLTYDNHMENVNVNENVIVDITVNESENKIILNEKKTKKRYDKFYIDVLAFDGDYPADMLEAFVNHWGEMTKAKDKMLWETKTTFEIKKRLVTWAGNNSKWNQPAPGRIAPARPAAASKLESAEDRNNDILDQYKNG